MDLHIFVFRSTKILLRVQVVANSTLQFAGTLTKQVRQVLEIIASGDAKLADKVLSGGLEVTVVVLWNVVFRAAEVCIR